MSRVISPQHRVISPQLQTWANALVRRISAKVPPVAAQRRRRLLVVHLDGVPKALLEDAVQNGTMPFFSRLVRSGHHHMDDAFWGSPASTPAFQAGFLYGMEHPNLPAYSWFDRELGRKVQMNTPKDALDIEARLGRNAERNSLLADGGHTYFSLFQAGARNRLCMSTLSSIKVMARSLKSEMEGILVARTTTPYAYMRSLGVDAWTASREVCNWARAVRDWRHERGYLISRVLFQRLGWSFAHTKALVDMVRGVPAIYLVFGNYDEVAHRRGPRSALALAELQRVDAYLAELFAVSRAVDEPYDLVFVTDHGHVDSLPLEQRQGKLQDVLFAGEAPPLPEDVRRGLLDGREVPHANAPRPESEPVVIEAGNFAHIYLSRESTPLEAAELVARHPEVVARAARNSDIAIAAVRRGNHAVALVKGGVYGPDEVDRAPLSTEFSKRAVADFLRELPHMKTAGDVVLFGEAVRQGGTVGFAWEFGSHGGLTNTETRSMVCWPSDAPMDLSGLGHASALHRKLSEVYRG